MSSFGQVAPLRPNGSHHVKDSFPVARAVSASNSISIDKGFTLWGIRREYGGYRQGIGPAIRGSRLFSLTDMLRTPAGGKVHLFLAFAKLRAAGCIGFGHALVARHAFLVFRAGHVVV